MDVKQILSKYDNDASRLMDILSDVQSESGYIPDEAVSSIADGCSLSRVDVEQTISFYHFFTKSPRGKYTVYLNNSAVAEMKGREAVAKAFEEEVGVSFGQVSADGSIGLFNTADIGMNDQEVAAIINDVVFTNLTPDRVKTLVADMKAGKSVTDMITTLGDGKNASEYIHAMVTNNIRKKGPVHFADYTVGTAVKKMVASSPAQVVETIKMSQLRGRGGAGFPTGMKWAFCAKSPGKEKYVFCNADEGEPGTFKDRVLLTEMADRVFEGMVIAAYAVGASKGVIYVRQEYRYLQKHLENVLAELRAANILGKNIAGKEGFDFDVRIQFGAGAYVCGEESALIESAEGKRGEPRNRPPFPVEDGYHHKPTTVNNVETFTAAVQIIAKGAEWFKNMGTVQSSGTKLVSISGDCEAPGIYEVDWGTTVQELLTISGAPVNSVQAVQIGGPSGTCIGVDRFSSELCFESLATGGSFIIIGKQRNLLGIVYNFMDFFTDESCGSCVPCRAGTWIMRNKIKRIMDGKGTQSDLTILSELGTVMKTFNKCGLGQTAMNPVITTMHNCKEVYDAVINPDSDEAPGFDMAEAVEESCKYANRTPHL